MSPFAPRKELRPAIERKTPEPVSNRTRQYPVPGHSSRVDRARRARPSIKPPSKGARIICFPECFVPGYRGIGKAVPPPDPEFLERAWSAIALAAAKADITVVLGTERLVDGALVATALVIDRDGSIAGFQDKVQIDPSEEGTYTPGSGRRVFQAGPVDFRCRDLPRRLAVSRDRPLGRTARSTDRVSPALPRSGARFLPASDVRRSREHLSREGGPLPRRREHLLFRNRQLREPRLSDHVGDRPPGWDTAFLPALRRGRIADRRHRHQLGDGPSCGTLQNGRVKSRVG